jgi:hypothetical protein
MAKIPVQLWAVILASMGASICFAVLFHHQDVNISLAVLGVGSNLVSGALGAFAGHAIGAAKADVTTGNAPVTINQTDPK